MLPVGTRARLGSERGVGQCLLQAWGGRGPASGFTGSQLGWKGYEQVYVRGRPDTGCAGESGVGDIWKRACALHAKHRAQWPVETCGGLRAGCHGQKVLWCF